jgi:hypothetical protein
MDSDSPAIISFTVCEAVRICSIAACDPFNKERVLRIYAALSETANDRPLSRKYVSPKGSQAVGTTALLYVVLACA